MHLIDFDDPDRRADGCMGCLPRTWLVGQNIRFPVWGRVDETPIIPRASWVECSLRHKVWQIVNQSSQSSCAAASTRGAVQLLREINGQSRVELSHGSLYGQANEGRDQGANIMAILEAMMDVGIAPTSIIDQYDWTDRDYPSKWKDHASMYRILEAYDCPSFDEMCSAVQRGMPVVFGVNWAGGGGHAISAIGLKKVGNGWGVEFQNSWGADWGDGGFGVLSESQCKAITNYGAFAVRSLVIPSNEELPPTPK